MKKFLILLLAVVMVFALAACGNSTSPDSSGPAAVSDSSLKVGVFYYAYSDTYISSVRTALDTALSAKGINYTDYDGNGNQTTQNEQIQTAITDGFNLLVVNMVTSGSSDVANQILSMAGGIPVVFFNRAIEADGEEGTVLNANTNIAFVGTDAPEAGHLQGQMIGEYLLANYDTVDLNGDGVISYAMMKGDEANVEAIYRTQYGVEDADAVLTAAGRAALEYFDASNASKYQVDLNGQWSAQAAQDYMQTNLSQYNDANGNMIELVICNNDNMAEGTISALNTIGYNTGEADAPYIPVFGVDATEAAQELIAAGKMTGTVKQDAVGMANAIAGVVEAVAAGSTTAEAVALVAGTAETYSVAEGIENKLYIAYAPYTG